jgi:phage shock protein PspC (stress-responsive transcriptional regulator)
MGTPTLDQLRSRLKLDRKNGWIAGVCAGLGRTLETDQVLIRTGFIIAALVLPKITIGCYLIAWMVLDEG